MRKFLIYIFLIVMPQTALATCEGTSFMSRLTDNEQAQLAERVAATPFARGVTWQATRGADTITLIGTMHIYDPRLRAIRDRVHPLVKSADILLVEATAKEETEMQASLAANPDMIFITEGPTLPEQLDEATWQAVADAARARQIPPFLAAKMRPWYLTLTLAIPPCAMPDMIAGVRGLDHMIMADAGDAGVPLQALEPWTTLIDVMRAGSPDDQRDMLHFATVAPEIQSEMFVAMLDSYFSGDIAEVWEASRLASNYIPGMDTAKAEALFQITEDLLLRDRNQRWLPVIEAATDQHDDIVVAVGAAHLPGEMGVLNLLAQSGWTIAAMQ